MRVLVGLAVVTATLLVAPSPGNAYDYPWCSREGMFGMPNCYFRTFDQCLETISGIGGRCERNYAYQAGRYPEPRRRKVRRRH